MIFLSSLTLSNTSSFLTRSVQLIFSILLQHLISELSRYFWSTVRSVQISTPHKTMLQMQHFTSFLFTFKSSLLLNKVFCLLNAAFVMTILYLISRVHFASFVIMLPTQFKYSTFSSCCWSIIICNGNGWLEILTNWIFFHIHCHYWKETIQKKVIMWYFFHLLSTSQY